MGESPPSVKLGFPHWGTMTGRQPLKANTRCFCCLHASASLSLSHFLFTRRLPAVPSLTSLFLPLSSTPSLDEHHDSSFDHRFTRSAGTPYDKENRKSEKTYLYCNLEVLKRVNNIEDEGRFLDRRGRPDGIGHGSRTPSPPRARCSPPSWC